MSIFVKKFSDGWWLKFDRGNFDDWCIYCLNDNTKQKWLPLDEEYFSQLLILSKKYTADKIYNDFCKVYNLTTNFVDEVVLNEIDNISLDYAEDGLSINKLFTILYMGMIAENVKLNAVVKKRIKRLGLYFVLIENKTPHYAAEILKGKQADYIINLCNERNIYL